MNCIACGSKSIRYVHGDIRSVFDHRLYTSKPYKCNDCGREQMFYEVDGLIGGVNGFIDGDGI